jgi:5-methylcytosine-specific restriction endonuclease McrA
MGDHVVPFSHGGRATEDNLVAACQGCNNSKCDRTPEQWLADGLRAS